MGTLASFLMEQIEEKADKDQDGKVTVEEIIGFEDFDFVEDIFPMLVTLGYPSGAIYYLSGEGDRPHRYERERDIVAAWLTTLQELMDQPEYSLPAPSTTCPGTPLEGLSE